MNKQSKDTIREIIRKKIDTTYGQHIPEQETKFLFDLAVIWHEYPRGFSEYIGWPKLEEDKELFPEKCITIEESHITKLNLEKWMLIALPDSLRQLTQLAKLYLAHNRLTNLPDTTTHLNQLSELNMSDNQLTEIPGFINQLINLKHLELGNNTFTKLPSSIGKLKNVYNSKYKVEN